MKSRRTLIVAFLLLAVMTIGIGYAAVVDTLDITGTADLSTTNAFEANVYFSETVVASTGNTASRNADNNDKCSFTASSMVKEGDTATFTFTIVNDNNKDATVSVKTHSNTDETHFGIAMSWDGATDAYADGATALTVPANGSAEVTVVVTLVSLPADYDSNTISATFVNELNVDDGTTRTE